MIINRRTAPVAAVALAIAAPVLLFASPFQSADEEPETPTEALSLPPDAPPEVADVIPVTPTPTPVPTPQPPPPISGPCAPSAAGQPLDAQVISYYGNPYTADMGILGQLEPERLVSELSAHAGLYDALNGPRDVQPALHLVYGTAQADPGRTGLHLLYVDDETLDEYVDLACDNGLLIFLDMQIGRSDVTSEIRRVLPYLRQPHVHAALDPEFAMKPGELPGDTIGSLDAADVNEAQRLIQTYVEEHHLPDKILIVHRFTEGMIKHAEAIEDFSRVKLVVDMDGFGAADVKRVKYGWYAAPAEHAGIKLFFDHDPDLMSEEEVIGLEPDVIIYQ